MIAVVGAGPAGLACAAMLQRRGEHVVVFERGDIGAAWTTCYERLHLHTSRWLSSLPGYRMPRAFGKWPSRDGVIEYLHRYADHTGVVVRTGVLDDRGESLVHGAQEHPRAPGLHFVGYEVTLGGTFRLVGIQASGWRRRPRPGRRSSSAGLRRPRRRPVARSRPRGARP